MDENILTILSDFGKDVENDEVLGRIGNLASKYNHSDETIVNILYNYLTKEKIVNKVITSDILDNFEKQESLLSVILDDDNDTDIAISSSNNIEMNVSFLSNYGLDQSIELKDIFNSSQMNSSFVDDTQTIEEFNDIRWPVEIVKSSNCKYGLMHQKKSVLVNAIEENTNSIFNKLTQSSPINEDEEILHAFDLDDNDEIEVYGRICFNHSLASVGTEGIIITDEFTGYETIFDTLPKLNRENVAIQTNVSGKKQLIPLILDQLDKYSLFPGQNVIVRGKNPTKSALIVSSISYPTPRDVYPIDNRQILGDLEVVVASGPFTENIKGDMFYLRKLTEKLRIHRCHVLIVVGPIVYVDEEPKNDQSFTDLYMERLKFLADSCIKMNTHLIIVPSVDDIAEIPVFPQPPYTLANADPIFNNSLIHFVSNPSIIKIGPYLFGLTSVDIIRHMGSQEFIKNCPSGRINRLCAHVLDENNFYPLKPSHPELSIDWNLWSKTCQFGQTLPHCLILVSGFSAFKEVVNNVLCINPGFIKKDSRRSTYCRLNVKETKDNTSTLINRVNCKFINL